uniref:Uncharacterized protein n=2 Tax=Oryza TaxID=4527 RepID=A0A0E0HFA2_ORYNI
MEFGGAAGGVDGRRPLMVQREVGIDSQLWRCGGDSSCVDSTDGSGRLAPLACREGFGGAGWRPWWWREYAWSAAGGRCGVRTRAGSRRGSRDEGGRVAASGGWTGWGAGAAVSMRQQRFRLWWSNGVLVVDRQVAGGRFLVWFPMANIEAPCPCNVNFWSTTLRNIRFQAKV